MSIRLRDIFIYTFFDMTLISLLSFILGLLIAYYFLLSETKVQVKIEEVSKGKMISWNRAVKGLSKDEVRVLKIIAEWNKIYQGELVKRIGFSKSKISRILGRLEYKGFIVRKRTGLRKLVISMVSRPKSQIEG